MTESSQIHPQYCGYCGAERGQGQHEVCEIQSRAIDVPRFCTICARRMVVQVTPFGWTAKCSRHGERSSSTSADVSTNVTSGT